MTGTVPEGWLGPEFEFIRILGRGATGWVALARQVPLDRLVAVKTMYGGTLDPAAAARVQREGRILAALNRPTIVSVYQLVAAPTALSLVMEYLPGGDLDHALAGGALTRTAAVGALCQVADALSAAAAAGVVHRDVKPSNVLLDGRGRAVLADFGLARLPGSAAAFRTQAGTVTGSPLYMAPEQIDDPDQATPAIDAYAFGVLCYRTLTGRHPFATVGLAQLYDAHRYSAPAPLPAWFPPVAAAALLAALDKRPSYRASPAQLAGALVAAESWTGPESWSAAESWTVTVPHQVSALPEPSGIGTEIGSGTVAAAGAVASGGGRLADPGEPTMVPAAPTTADARPALAAIGAVPMDREPAAEQWVEPPVYRAPPETDRRRRALVAGVVVGLVIGVLVYLLLMRG